MDNLWNYYKLQQDAQVMLVPVEQGWCQDTVTMVTNGGKWINNLENNW